MNFFSENLKNIRETWRYKSQDEFGKLFRLNKGNINNLENGKVKPKLDLLFKLEDATGLTIRELYLLKLKMEDIPEKPFRHGEGLKALTDKAEQFGFEKENAPTPIGELVALREAIAVQKELIEMQRERIKFLERK